MINIPVIRSAWKRMEDGVDHTLYSMKHSWWGKIVAEHDTEPEELKGGTINVGAGIWLLLPFNTYASSPTFYAMVILPEVIWGLLFLLLGTLHLMVLRRGDYYLRSKFSFISFILWGALGIVFMLSNPPAFGWLFFMYVSIGQGWCTIRLRQMISCIRGY